MSKLLDIVSALSGGNSKIITALQKAIEIANSGKYQSNMQGALQIAKDSKFTRDTIASMQQYANNSKFMQGLNMVAPGAAGELKSMFSQFSSAVDTQQTAPPVDDFTARLSRLK